MRRLASILRSWPPGLCDRADVELLACPDCHGGLRIGPGAPDPHRGSLTCDRCSSRWPIDGGLARLYREERVQGTDRLMQRIYDALPAMHAPANRYLLPVLQFRTEMATRSGYLPRLELDALAAGPDGEPARVLEVGIGDGIGLSLMERSMPPGVPVQIWGVDFSEGMLRQCQRRIRRDGHAPVRLVMGDAHALPFPDDSFDRVFHVGAAGSYRDPALALAEMARVAKPGTPIVVVDEQLDPRRSHGLYQRAAFRALTFYDQDPHAPVELLPDGATDVVSEQISRFYYCLRFRVES